MAYITTDMLAARLSAVVVRRLYDDDNDGTADTDPLAQLVQDAEARFEAFARGIYSLTALRDSPPNEAIRLCLDLAEAMAYRRFPKAATREWIPFWEAVEKELTGLRTGKTRLDVESTPEPAANQGGDYYEQGEALSGDPPDTFTNNGFGDF